MPNHFTIKIQCKKYVKAYLENNCGAPVDLKNLPDLMCEFRRCLSKKPEHRENADVANWPETVTLIIPPDMFYRHGWEMNRENVLDFTRKAEQKAKFFMRQYVAFNNCLGIPVSLCVREFQEQFGFYEPVWSFESIRKDFSRNGRQVNLKTMKNLKIEINDILMANLSDLGTISQKFKKEYCYG